MRWSSRPFQLSDFSVRLSAQVAACGLQLRLVDDDIGVGIVEFEVRDVEFANRIHGRDDRAIALLAAAPGAQFLPDLAQRPQDAGAIEALTGTVFTEAHTEV